MITSKHRVLVTTGGVPGPWGGPGRDTDLSMFSLDPVDTGQCWPPVTGACHSKQLRTRGDPFLKHQRDSHPHSRQRYKNISNLGVKNNSIVLEKYVC